MITQEPQPRFHNGLGQKGKNRPVNVSLLQITGIFVLEAAASIVKEKKKKSPDLPVRSFQILCEMCEIIPAWAGALFALV